MSISKIIGFGHDLFEKMQSAGAISALHPLIDAPTKRLDFSGLINRALHGIRLAPGSSQSGRTTNRSNGWRQIMLTLIPPMGVGLLGSLLTAIALAADWYIWRFRYWVSKPSTALSATNKSVIHVSMASGREFVASHTRKSAPGNIPAVQSVES